MTQDVDLADAVIAAWKTSNRVTMFLFENLSSDRVGDGIERHVDEAKFIPSRETSRLQRIEAEDFASALCTGARNAQPAVETGRRENINAVTAS